MDVITASGLLPAGTAVLPPADTNGVVWKSDMWFGDKALGLKATVTDVIHYCQLDWMKALQHRWMGTIPTIGKNHGRCCSMRHFIGCDAHK